MTKVDIYNNAENKYNIIYADPPWRYSDRGCSGACEKHYKTMAVDEICNLPVRHIADKDCVLFMWTTYPMLKESLKVMDAWGFAYKTIAFQWLKQNRSGKGYYFGLGRWTRGNTEPCLLATKGKPYKYKINSSVFQIINYPVGRHSSKPPIVRDKIVELLGDLPRIELFAREKADGWDYWGDEV